MSDALCYGDIVALDGGACFLESDGHRDARLWAREASALGDLPDDQEGCLFELLPMLQYAARREELLVIAPLGEASSSAGTDAAIRRLRHRVAAEAAENQRTVAAWRGPRA